MGCAALRLAFATTPAGAFSTGPAEITLNGETIPIESFACAPDPTFSRSSICSRGDVVAADGSWTWVSPVLELDPGGSSGGTIDGQFALRNETDATLDFTLSIRLPMTTTDAFLPDEAAIVDGTLHDEDGNGALFQSGFLQGFYALTGSVDGAVTLGASGGSITAPPSGTAHIGSFGFRYYGPRPQSSIQLTFDFELSPHDSASFDHVYFWVVPEPGTSLLVGVGLAALARRRSR